VYEGCLGAGFCTPSRRTILSSWTAALSGKGRLPQFPLPSAKQSLNAARKTAADWSRNSVPISATSC
jgi:hypothetical protein